MTVAGGAGDHRPRPARAVGGRGRPAEERTTVVVCDDWPAVALTDHRRRSAAPGPVAMVVVHANRVVAASPASRSAGVEVGLRRREAQRRCPDAVVVDRDVGAEARRFEAVIRAMDELVHRVEVETPGWCSFDTRGPSHYFGGDEDMNLRLVELVDRAVRGATTVRVGTADTRFAALQAAFVAGPGEARVVPSDATAAFLAGLPMGALLRAERLADPAGRRTESDLAALVHVVCRLGLTSLGDFAELTPADVVGRFGAIGRLAHRRARGEPDHLPEWCAPPEDLDVHIDVDPPVERIDRAAFIAKALADEFCAALAVRGLTCTRVAVGARTEHGEELVRLWRGEGSLSAGAIADRMRWQLDGWLTTAGPRSGGLVHLWLHPEQVLAATGRQLGFWGGQSQNADRAVRAVARAQGLLGEGSVTVPEVAGGRSIREQVIRLPAEAVDLAERARAEMSADAAVTAGVASTGLDPPPWPGQLPAPFPVRVHPTPVPIGLVDDEGLTVSVSARGALSAPPVAIVGQRVRSSEVVAWSGPWLLDERWWDADRRSRRVHLQVVTADDVGLLIHCAGGQWFCDAIYA